MQTSSEHSNAVARMKLGVRNTGRVVANTADIVDLLRRNNGWSPSDADEVDHAIQLQCGTTYLRCQFTSNQQVSRQERHIDYLGAIAPAVLLLRNREIDMQVHHPLQLRGQLTFKSAAHLQRIPEVSQALAREVLV